MTDNKKILIVEDEAYSALQLEILLKKANYSVVGIATSIEQAKNFLLQETPDLVLLDIRLDEMEEGFEIAHFIDSSSKTPYIYISAYSDEETILKLMKTNPISYLLKPFNETVLLTNINMVFKKIEQKDSESNIILKEGGKEFRIPLNEILYLNSDGNYTFIHTTFRKYVFKKSLREIIKKTDSNFLIRVHKSFIVNKLSIKEKTLNKFILTNNHIIPIGRTYRSKLK